MHPPLTPETKAFWSIIHSKKKQYPYWCTTSVLNPVSSLIRIPHLRLVHDTTAYWAFKDLEKLHDFNKRYGGEAWNPNA